jgi:oligosaccharide reducing-end xylanase
MKRKYFIAILAIVALFAACKNPVENDLPDGNKTYTVTFDKNHSDAAGWNEANPKTKTVKPPATTVETLPTAPTRAGYNFVNWKDSSGSVFTATTEVTKSITVYAQWKDKEIETPDTYTIILNISGDEPGDSVAVSPTSGKAGDTITVSYTLAETKTNNQLVFSGVTGAIEPVTTISSGTWNYTVNSGDAVEGTITINAAFTHTNKQIDNISFDENEINKIYGDAPFLKAISSQGSGTGAITYSSGDTGVATVNASTGQVTILKAGHTTITATKEEDETYAEATTSYTLVVEQLQLTISAPSVTPKTYDGTTDAKDTVTLGSLTNKVNGDDVNVTYIANYNSPDVAEVNQITVVYSISGAQADNYIKPVDSGVAGTITKAAGAALAGSIAFDGEPTETSIKLQPVTAPNNGQTVEYAISMLNQSPVNGWQDGVTFSGLTSSTTYYIFARAKENNNYYAGTQAISGSIKTKETYTVSLVITGNESGDSVTMSNPITGVKAGDTITVSYTLAETKANNRLVFSGVTGAIEPVTTIGNGTWTYTVNSGDAVEGTITISAAFTHTNKQLDSISFAGDVNKIYGDVPFTVTVSDEGSGTGTITYASNNADVATVNASTGQVTIHKAGNATITATKAEDVNYAGATASFNLHVAQLQLTISGTTVTKTKTYNGDAAAAVTNAGTLTNKAGNDSVTPSATAVYNSANVGTNKTITVTYTISGAQADNYTAPVSSTVSDGTITALQLTISNPNLTTSKQYDGTTTAAVTAGTLSGKLPADTVTVSASAAYSSASLGTNKTITVTYSITGASAGNYTKPVNYTVNNGAITAKQLTISGTAVTATKTYDGTTTAAVTANGTLGGRVGSETVNVSATAAYNSADAGTNKTITITYTISGTNAGNYIKPANATQTGTINKAAGGSVTVPAVSGTPTSTSITVNTVATPSGQTVEYAISTSTTAPSSGWQTGTTFNNLTANTNYYVYARSASNTNYDAGTAQRSAVIKTAASGGNPNPVVPPVKVDFETDASGATTKYTFTRGDNDPALQIVADPAASSQKSLRIATNAGSGGDKGYNQAAVIPITLPYSVESWGSLTFRFYLSAGTMTNQTISVYVGNNTNQFVRWGFGNPSNDSNQFANLLLGTVQASTTSGSWQNLTIPINNPGSPINNYKNTVYLAIGMNQAGTITYMLDDITFTINSGFVPPPVPVTPNPPSVGAVTSGTYRNLFKEWGKTDAQIDAKVTAEWNKKFVNGTTDEMLYVQASDSSMAYIYTADTDDVRSEGMSYGMMMCVQMDDQTRFNKLWKWAHTNMYHDRNTPNTGKNIRGFFSWQCRTNGTAMDTGPAPDGEFYFVTALLFAENRWGNGSGINNYGQYARYIMYDMLHREPKDKPGSQNLDNNGAIPMINPTYKIPEFTTVTAQHTDASYMLPAFYDVWAMEIRNGTSYHNSIWGSQSAANADATYWEEVATSCRDYLKNSGVLHATTGLGSDYSSYTGSPTGHVDFEYDAWRIAMNIGFDYAWFAKDTWQKTQSDRIQAFFQGEGVTSYGNRYTRAGSKLGSDHSPGLVACNAVASLAATHERAWEFIENFWDIPVTTGKYRYYDGCLYMMGLLHVTGKFKAYLSTGGGSTNPYISPTSAAFNKYTSSADYKDIAVTMTLNGSTLSNIKNGDTTLTQGNSVYTVSGSTVTIKTAYLAQQSVGTTTLTFTFSNGTTRNLSIDIVNTAPTPVIAPTTATFDKKTGAQADVVVTMTLNGSTLSNIKNGSTTLTEGNNVYTVSGSTVTIKAAYLAQRANGNTTLTFTFSDGTTRNIVITIGDTTGGGTEYNFATDSPAVSTSGSGLSATITGGVLQVTKTSGYSTPYLIIPFDLGGTTLGSYSKILIEFRGVSGDFNYKTLQVEVQPHGTAPAGNTNFGSFNNHSMGSSFATTTVNRSGNASTSMTGQIDVIISLNNTQAFVYEIKSIKFVQ